MSERRESSNEGLTLETSASKLFTVVNLRYNSTDNSELSCYTFPPIQHHIHFRNQTYPFIGK